jgi:hypothetical protein
MVKEYAKHDTSMRRETNRYWLRLLRASSGFLLGLSFYPEDGGEIFFRNVG